MPEERFDSIVTDPPYGIGYRNKRAKHQRPQIINDSRPFVWWLWDAARVLKEGGALVCFCRWDVQDSFRWAIELAGLRVRAQWVWDRMMHGMGDCQATLAPRHDLLWFATKGKFKFSNGRPTSIIAARSVPGATRVHPTEKPGPLMRRVVRAVTPRGGIVLDPCMGSGATGEAVRDGYGFVGIEIDATHFRAAHRRLRQCIRERKRTDAAEDTKTGDGG